MNGKAKNQGITGSDLSEAKDLPPGEYAVSWVSYDTEMVEDTEAADGKFRCSIACYVEVLVIDGPDEGDGVIAGDGNPWRYTVSVAETAESQRGFQSMIEMICPNRELTTPEQFSSSLDALYSDDVKTDPFWLTVRQDEGGISYGFRALGDNRHALLYINVKLRAGTVFMGEYNSGLPDGSPHKIKITESSLYYLTRCHREIIRKVTNLPDVKNDIATYNAHAGIDREYVRRQEKRRRAYAKSQGAAYVPLTTFIEDVLRPKFENAINEAQDRC